MDELRILVTHPLDWMGIRKDLDLKTVVRHVSIGGDIPKRPNGMATWDGIGEVVIDEGVQELYNAVQEFQPDVFLFGIHFYFYRHYIEHIKKLCPKMKVVMHYTDQREDVPNEVGAFENLLDMLLITNQDPKEKNKFLDFGIPIVETLYDGINLHDYWPMPKPPMYDCFFGGNNHMMTVEYYKNRKAIPPDSLIFPGNKFRHDFLSMVNDHFSLIVRGMYGWEGLRFLVKSPKYHPQYLSIMREARIVLGTAVSPRYKLYMRRHWRGLACGRMLITEYVPGMEEDFVQHKHLCYFKEIPEGMDYIRYYLSRDEARERIARQARELIANQHTTDHRLAQFVGLIRKAWR